MNPENNSYKSNIIVISHPPPVLEKAKKVLGIKSDAAQIPKNAKPVVNEISSLQSVKSIDKSTQQSGRAVSAQATKLAIGPAQPIAGSRTLVRSEPAAAQRVAKSPASSQAALRTDDRPVATKGAQPKPKLKTPSAIDGVGKKGHRRPKNTQVISMQMPRTLIGVLDEIVEAGAYRNRSDLMLQAIRAFPIIDERLRRLKLKQVQQKND